MRTYTFFLRDESIHEAAGENKDDAFRALCLRLGKSWGWLHGEVLDVFTATDEQP